MLWILVKSENIINEKAPILSTCKYIPVPVYGLKFAVVFYNMYKIYI